MGKIQNELLDLNSAKHAIRQAINDNGGTLTKADPLAVYPEEINKISLFTENEIDSRHRVIFVDWDGTPLADLYVKDGAAVIPPAVPKHEHLSFVRWTHPASELLSVKSPLCIGARYAVEDDALFFFVKDSSTVTINLVNRADAATFEIFWGDGQSETFSLTSNNTITLSHTYESVFSGWIKVPAVNGYTLRYNSSSAGNITKILAGGRASSATYETLTAPVPICMAYYDGVLKGCFQLKGPGVVCDFVLMSYVSSWSGGEGFAYIAVDPFVQIPNNLVYYFFGRRLYNNKKIIMLEIPASAWASTRNFEITSPPGLILVVRNPAKDFNVTSPFVYVRGTQITVTVSVGRFDIDEGLKFLSTLTVYAEYFPTFQELCRVLRKLGDVETAVIIRISYLDTLQREVVAEIVTAKGYTLTS